MHIAHGRPTITRRSRIARSGSYLTIREGQPMPDAVPHEWITLARDVIHRNVADLAPNPVRANAYGEVFSRDHRFVLGATRRLPTSWWRLGFRGTASSSPPSSVQWLPES